jgi:hypothetical protein
MSGPPPDDRPSPGDDGDGMYGWDDEVKEAWKARLARMVDENEAHPG